jgi:hypothetical protein
MLQNTAIPAASREVVLTADWSIDRRTDSDH